MKLLCQLLGTVYSLFFLMTLGIGLQDGLSERSFPQQLQKCGQPLARIEYVMPGFQIGCWLGTIPNRAAK